jgi:hypothetical protein
VKSTEDHETLDSSARDLVLCVRCAFRQDYKGRLKFINISQRV